LATATSGRCHGRRDELAQGRQIVGSGNFHVVERNDFGGLQQRILGMAESLPSAKWLAGAPLLRNAEILTTRAEFRFCARKLNPRYGSDNRPLSWYRRRTSESPRRRAGGPAVHR